MRCYCIILDLTVHNFYSDCILSGSNCKNDAQLHLELVPVSMSALYSFRNFSLSLFHIPVRSSDVTGLRQMTQLKIVYK